jgi:hypothetical protein
MQIFGLKCEVRKKNGKGETCLFPQTRPRKENGLIFNNSHKQLSSVSESILYSKLWASKLKRTKLFIFNRRVHKQYGNYWSCLTSATWSLINITSFFWTSSTFVFKKS